MKIEILPAHHQVQQLNEIDPSRIMVGHGIGFSCILQDTEPVATASQFSLFDEFIEVEKKEKHSVVQLEGWVLEVLPEGKFKVSLQHLKLDHAELIVDASQIETHSSFRRSLRRHIAAS